MWVCLECNPQTTGDTVHERTRPAGRPLCDGQNIFTSLGNAGRMSMMASHVRWTRQMVYSSNLIAGHFLEKGKTLKYMASFGRSLQVTCGMLTNIGRTFLRRYTKQMIRQE